jgi:hypothetical protein
VRLGIPHADELGIGGFRRITLAIFADCDRFSGWASRSEFSVHSSDALRRSE